MDSQVAYNATVVSGTMSSNGSSGGTASWMPLPVMPAAAQTTTVDMKSALYQDVERTVSKSLTPGIGLAVHVDGFITVTDTTGTEAGPDVGLKRNEEMKARVVQMKLWKFGVIRKTRNEQRWQLSAGTQSLSTNAGTPKQHSPVQPAIPSLVVFPL